MSPHDFDPLADTWASRDFPVLRAAAAGIENDETFTGVEMTEIATATDLSVDQVLKSVLILQDAGLVETQLVMSPRRGRVKAISPGARRLVGLWPSSETALDRMVKALESIAADGAHPARGEAARAVDAFHHAGDAFQAVAAAALTGEMP